jgi:hypothetical protein
MLQINHVRVNTVIHYILVIIRWPILLGLSVSAALQFGSLINPILRPEQLNMPDIIPPINTVVMAVLWWRVTQLEHDWHYFRDRLDRMTNGQLTKHKGETR